jgi:hypothetical protein
MFASIHFDPRPVLENNNGYQDMAGSYLTHSYLPPYTSVSRSKHALAFLLSIFEVQILAIPKSEIRKYSLDYLRQGPQIHFHFLLAVGLRPQIVL